MEIEERLQKVEDLLNEYDKLSPREKGVFLGMGLEMLAKESDLQVWEVYQMLYQSYLNVTAELGEL